MAESEINEKIASAKKTENHHDYIKPDPYYSIESDNPGTVEVIAESQQNIINAVCRDYFRGECKRTNCKYIHDVSKCSVPVKFCHDFQNKGCTRNKCIFVHCTMEEENNYYNTGQLIISDNIPLRDKRQTMSSRENLPPLPPPFFLPPLDRPPPPPPPAYPPPNPMYYPHPPMEDYYPMPPTRPPLHSRNEEIQCFFTDSSINDKKRKCNEEDIKSIRECENCQVKDKNFSDLQDQLNQALRKNAQLEKENDKLKSANEFLLDQTATLRGYTKQVTLVNASNTQSIVSPQILRNVNSGSMPIMVSGANMVAGPLVAMPAALTTSQHQLVVSGSSAGGTQQILVTTSPRTQILEVTPSPQFLVPATSQQQIIDSNTSHSQILGANVSQAQLMSVNSSQSQMLGVTSPQPTLIRMSSSQSPQILSSEGQFLGVSGSQQIIVTNSGQRQLIAVASSQQSATQQQQLTNIANINGQLMSSTQRIINATPEQQQIIASNPEQAQLLQTMVIASQGQALVQPSMTPQLQIVTNPTENSQGLSSTNTQPIMSYPVSQTILHT